MHALEGVIEQSLGRVPRLAQAGGLARSQPRTLAPIRSRAVMRRDLHILQASGILAAKGGPAIEAVTV
jgi:hypothetical protein